MLKKSLLSMVLAVVALAGCEKAPEAAKPAAAKSQPAESTVREATFNPNLVPENIVWDSEEKRKEWEAKHPNSAHGSAAPAQK
ncbi:hypothetical protein LC612_37480 [Nostoc sp. CHAB 5834]|nr:hypothetical protein [Nostoc sp. CHAB 5834]